MKASKHSVGSNIMFGICIVLTVVLVFLSNKFSKSGLTAANGIVAQLQVVVSTLMVVTNHRRGYIVSTAFNIVYMVYLAVFIVGRLNQTSAIPGTITNAITIVTITLIYISWKRQQKMHDDLNESYNKQIETNNIMRQKDEKLLQLAYSDMLTGLPNRARFMDILNEYMEESQPFYVICANIDGFRTINDNFGHNTGDAMLMKMAERLTTFIGENGVVARIGGDDFAMVMRNTGGDQGVLQDVEELRMNIAEPFAVGENMFGATFSFGIAAYPQEGYTSEDILVAADTALYNAKINGKNRTFFARQDTSYYL